LTKPAGLFAWFGEFLKNELTPYPGRGVTVARMVIAATITMILTMTFRIPGGAVGGLYAFFISRDSLRSTLKSAATVVTSYAAGVLFILVGAYLFADEPVSQFMWFVGSLFVVFFVLRTLQTYNAATSFALLIVSALPLWHLPESAEFRVEMTLWQALAVAVGTLVTVLVEVIFYSLHAKDELFEGLDGRWIAVERLLSCYADNEPVSADIRQAFVRYAMIGASGLRRILARSEYGPQYREQMTAVVGLTGRLIDIGSTAAQMPYRLIEGDPERISEVARRLEEIRQAVAAKGIPPAREMPQSTPSGIPLLPEIERTVALMPRVFSGDESIGAYLPTSLEDVSESGIFVRDAFSNPAHVTFALRGCLAASLCYFIYTIVDWRGLATSVTTCVLTALSNIGSSRQKQLLRVSGAVVGGVILGLGSQVFILPHLDSITQFAVLFVAVTAVAAWFATSSPRLSYMGIQIALAFYLINLEEFTIQTSLAIGRDRVAGILLGLSIMWIVFDQIGAKQAAQEMIEVFTANLRLFAQFTVQSTKADPESDIKRIRRMRDKIFSNFQTVSAQADAIPFEFGYRRPQHMEARAHIRRWQPSLRTLYLMELALIQYRIFGVDSEFPKPLLDIQYRFNQGCAQILDTMADRLEGKDSIRSNQELEATFRNLEKDLASAGNVASGTIAVRAEGLLNLSGQFGVLLEELFQDVIRTPSAVFVAR
jgi:multidrug resistance protein MdtO